MKVVRFGGAALFLDFFQASGMSDDSTRERFRSDLHEVFSRYNRATDGMAVVENRYLLTVATRA